MKIDSAFSENITIAKSLNELIENLNIGDLFRAKVLNITSGEILLKLLDGTQLKASSDVLLELMNGDFADFVVKAKDGEKLILETVNNKPIKAPIPELTLDKKLSSLNIKDSSSKDIAKDLFTNNMKVDIQTIDKIKKLVTEFKSSNLTPQKAIFLLQNEVPIIKENIELLNGLINKEFNIASKLETLSTNLSKLPVENLNQLSKNLSLLESFEKLPILLEKLSQLSNSVQNSENSKKADNFVDKLPVQIKTTAPELGKELQTSTLPPKVSLLPDLDNMIKTAIQKIINNSSEISNLQKIISANSSLSVENFEKSTLEILRQFFSPEKASDILMQTKPTDIIMPDKNTTNKEKALDIVNKIFDNCFVKLDENLTSKDIDINEIYKKILHRISIIKDLIEPLPESSVSDLKSNIASFDKQLSFSNQINNTNNTFIQIPLNYEGYKNGELYIVKKKNPKKKNTNDGTTLFLSLETINIGRFETLVNVKDKNLKIFIRLEKDELIDFVKRNYNILYDMLAKTTYKIVDIKCKKIDEAISPINLEAELKNEFIGETKSINIQI